MALLRMWVFFGVLSILTGQLARAQVAPEYHFTCKDQPLSEVFNQLKSSHGLVFAYDPGLVHQVRITGTFQEKSLQKTLRALLRDTQLDFKVVREKYIIIKQKGKGASRFRLIGQVKDKETGEPLPYANILIPDKKTGVTTDENGRFSLKEFLGISPKIVVKYVGYEPVELRIPTENIPKDMVVELSRSNQQLEEVVIVQGTQQTMKVADAASQININPKKISSLSGLGEKDIFRSLKLLPGIGGTNVGQSGLYVRGGTPDQNLVLFDGITAYRVDHFFGLFSTFNAEAVQHIDVYRGGFGAEYGGRVSSVIDITGRNGRTDKAAATIGANLLNTNAAVEVPLFKGKGSFLLTARRAYTDVIRSPIFKSLFQNIVDQSEPEEVKRDPQELRNASVSSQDFYLVNQRFSFSPIPNNYQGPSFDAASYYNLNSQLNYKTRSQDLIQEGETPAFHYYDINSRLSLQVSKKDFVALSVYKGSDKLAYEYNDEPLLGIQVNTLDQLRLNNFGSSVTWSRQWNNRVYSKTNFAHSRYGSNYQYLYEGRDVNSMFSAAILQRNQIHDYTLRSSTHWNINEENSLEVGTQISRQDIDVFLQTDSLDLQKGESGASGAFYFQHTFTPHKDFTFKFGTRGTYFDLTKKVYIEPRLSIKLSLSDRFKLKGAWGLYNQFVNRINVNNGLGLGEDFWAVADGKEIPIMSSFHYILGLAYETPLFLIDVEAYHKSTNGLITYSLGPAPVEVENETATAGDGELVTGGTSTVNGVDVLLQKKIGNYTGWISYSLSQVKQSFPDIERGRPFPALYDQSHELKTAHILTWRKWDLASTFIFASGRPYTGVDQTLKLQDASSPSESETTALLPGKINSRRLPPYHRLDLSLTYNFDIKSVDAKIGVSLYNAYAKRNIRSRRFVLIEPATEDQEATISTTDIHDLGITPNLFFQVRF